MRNAAPRLRDRLGERLRATGEHGEVLSVRQLKEEFGFASGELLTRDRRERIQAWLDEAGVRVEPSLTSPERPRNYELRASVPERPPQLEPPPAQPEPVAPASVPRSGRIRRGLSRGWQGIAGVSLLGTLMVLFVVDLPAAWDRLTPDPPEVLRGDLNVAVASLAAPEGATEDEQAEVEALSDVLHRSIRSGITAARPAEGLRVAYRGPSAIEPLAGPSAAAALARKIRADFVLYGDINRSGPELRVIPKFWVSPRLVQQATELTGPYNAGDPLSARDVTTNIAVRERIRRGVGQRARGLSHLMVGLSHYVLTDYKAARRTLEAAEATRGLEGAGGRKLLALFAGNIALKAENYKAAGRHYRRALALDDTYHRARLGLADALFASSRHACGPQADLAGIARAEAELRAIRIRPSAPDAPTARARQRFGLGRMAVCRLLAKRPRGSEAALSAAREHFDAVIAAAPDAGGLLDEAAAESHGQLGLLRWVFGTGGARAAATEALVHYRAAFRLSRRDDRRALYLRREAEMLERLGRRREAAVARRRADSLERLVETAMRGDQS